MKALKIIGTILSVIIIMLGLFLIGDVYVYSFTKMTDNSMQASVTEGDYIVVDRISSNFDRFDLVAVKSETQNEYSIKRIIGLPGEKIEYIQNVLYVNGTAITEDFLETGTITSYFTTVRLFPQNGGKIPDNQYFVVNDNRAILTDDSRTLGALEKDVLIGVVRLRLYPLNKIGLL